MSDYSFRRSRKLEHAPTAAKLKLRHSQPNRYSLSASDSTRIDQRICECQPTALDRIGKTFARIAKRLHWLDRKMGKRNAYVGISALFQFKVPVLHVSRLGASPGFSDESVASAKTAHPKIKLEQCTSIRITGDKLADIP